DVQYRGGIPGDGLGGKAVASGYGVPSVALLAVEAGGGGVLICSGDHDTQAAALESLVHAIEDERLRPTRVEDALARLQRAKERFLAAAPIAARPPHGRALRAILGRDEHRAIADEMARFL